VIVVAFTRGVWASAGAQDPHMWPSGSPRRAEIVALVLRQGMFLVAVGSIIGLMLAAAVTRLLNTLLFGVRPDRRDGRAPIRVVTFKASESSSVAR
jgi:hypothetical protein